MVRSSCTDAYRTDACSPCSSHSACLTTVLQLSRIGDCLAQDPGSHGMTSMPSWKALWRQMCLRCCWPNCCTLTVRVAACPQAAHAAQCQRLTYACVEQIPHIVAPENQMRGTGDPAAFAVDPADPEAWRAQIFRSIDSDSAEGMPTGSEAAALGLDSGKGKACDRTELWRNCLAFCHRFAAFRNAL